MQRFSALILLFLLLLLPVSSFACGGFAFVSPPGTYFRTDPDTNILIWFRDGTQTTVIEPSFEGNAQDFAMIMPFPSKPSVERAPKDLFAQLDDITSPTIKIDPSTLGYNGGMPDMFPSIKVIERKNVGDYTAVVLQAGDGSELYGWLKQNGFEVKENDKDNYEYYIQNGGAYFVALKTHLPGDRIASDGTIKNRLRPIAFTYKTDRPYLAHRIFRDISMDMHEDRTYNLYLLADRMYIVPGERVIYSDKITKSEVTKNPSLLRYNAEDQWLTRSTITVNHSLVNEDLFPVRLSQNVKVNRGSHTVFNADQTPIQAGIIAAPDTVNIESIFGDSQTYTLSKQSIPVATDKAVAVGKSALPQLRLIAVITLLIVISLLFFIFLRIKSITNYMYHSMKWIHLGIAIGTLIGLFKISPYIISLITDVYPWPLPISKFIFFLMTIIFLFFGLPGIFSIRGGWKIWRSLVLMQFLALVLFVLVVLFITQKDWIVFMVKQYIDVLLP